MGDVRYRLIAGRLEGCPLRFGGDAFFAQPCVGFDLGALRVEGTQQTGQADTGLWASVDASGRLSWRATRPVSFEAQLGALVPLTRYTLTSKKPPTKNYRTRLVGFFAGLGATARLP